MPKPFTYLVGLRVVDDRAYDQYRAGMRPLLEAMGGGFGLDIDVAAIREAGTAVVFNRLFTINFPDAAVADEFFDDRAYLAIRATYFDRAVTHQAILGTYVDA